MECPICGNREYSPYLECKDHSISQEIFTIKNCTTCGLLTTIDAPSEQHIGPYYASINYISHTDEKSDLLSSIYKLVRNYMLTVKYNLLKKYLPITPSKAIDIGSGMGHFAAFMKSKGVNTIGYEPSDLARTHAYQSNGLTAYPMEDFFLHTEKVDLISMWHVLEHVHEPQRLLQKIAERLNPQGALCIAVPNANARDAAYYREYWAAYDVPRHLWHFKSEQMVTLLDKFGFQLKEKKGMPFDAFYVSLMSEKYRKNTFWPISGIFRGLLTVLNSIGNVDSSSSIIYIFQLKKVKQIST
ncbi:MAG: class I SAM-dependent methyltransferase [Saprospiraceae bacterium]|nr:class I SAM-dependent methyltransferase [Saprospiraceae bacterium]